MGKRKRTKGRNFNILLKRRETKVVEVDFKGVFFDFALYYSNFAPLNLHEQGTWRDLYVEFTNESCTLNYIYTFYSIISFRLMYSMIVKIKVSCLVILQVLLFVYATTE
jgi:hypothetical protein